MSMKKHYFFSLIAMLFCVCANATSELTFSNVSLAPNSVIEAITLDQQITFNTNMDDEIGYMYAEIKDETSGNIVGTRTTVYDPNFNNDGEGTVSSNMPQTKKDPHFTYVNSSYTKMEEGHTYSLIFYAFTNKDASHGAGQALATGAIKYEGGAAAYIPSPFKLVSITPDIESHVITKEEERSVTLHFNAKVRISKEDAFILTGNGAKDDLEEIVPGDDAEIVTTKDKEGTVISEYTYSSSWTLTPKVSTIADGADVNFSATVYDKSGLRVTATVKGLESYSTGNSESSYYTFSVMNDLNRTKFEITPEENNNYVNSLYSFVVSETNEGISAANIAEDAVLYLVGEDGKKEQVATIATIVDNKVIEGDPSEYQDTQVLSQRLFLDKQITKAGKYILHFPRNYFNFGTGMMATSSASTDFEYTIAKDFVAPKVKVVGNTTVKKLAKIEIQYPDYQEVAPCPDGEQTGYVLNENNELVTKASLEACFDYEDANIIDVNLKTPITAPGKYTLIIPQDGVSVSASSFFAARNAKGGTDMSEDNEFVPDYTLLGAFVQEFTVEAGDVNDVTMKVSIENNSTVEGSIESIDLTFASASGQEVIVECTGWDTDALWRGDAIYASSTTCKNNVATVIPYSGGRKTVYGISAPGKYTVTFPAGFFTVNGVDWPEIKLSYTITEATEISGVTEGEKKAKNAYTLSGAEIAPSQAVNGTYIVDGKKVVVK